MNLRQVDLNLLVALDILMEERNVTRASERLFVSQSAMSGILSRLREFFDDEILVRVGREFVPTSLALELSEPVHNIVMQVDELINANRVFDPRNASLKFEIAATDYVALILLPPLLRKLEKLAPNICIRIRKYDQATKYKLAEGNIDFIISGVKNEITEVESIPLFNDVFSGVAWAGNDSLKDGKIATDDFLSAPHLAFNIGESIVDSIIDYFFESQGIERNIVAYTDSFTTAPFILHESSIMCVMPTRIAQRLKNPAEIVILDIPIDFPVFTETLEWGTCFSNSPPHKWLREQIVAVAKSL